MSREQVKSLESPDNVLKMERGRFEIVAIADGGVGRATFEPGWRWSTHEKPAVGATGDYCTIPAGHDGWAVGDLPAVMVDFGGVARPF